MIKNKPTLIIPYKIKEKGWGLVWWSSVHLAYARLSSILIIKKIDKSMKSMRHPRQKSMNTFAIYFSEKDQRDASQSSQLTPT